ncbi:hypothetical protein L7F22_008000 [Adiantum nelumboides]|nr:hypothetical protein [Adiantum nelumboides]
MEIPLETCQALNAHDDYTMKIVVPRIDKLKFKLQGSKDEDSFCITYLDGEDVIFGMPRNHKVDSAIYSMKEKVEFTYKGKKYEIQARVSGNTIPMAGGDAEPSTPGTSSMAEVESGLELDDEDWEDVRSKQALFSLSNKANLEFLGRSLIDLGYTIISTGGTAEALEKASIAVRKVEELTDFPEMLDGRVKTLHPHIHGGILARRDFNTHMEQLKQWNIGTIDIVIVNLYPFYDTVTASKAVSFENGVEKIDIGGPAMIRAAAKNHRDVLVVVDPEDYGPLIEHLQEKGNTEDHIFRRRLAWKAFQHVASYDSAVAEWLWKQTSAGDFAPALTVPLSESSSLRYGENPHQKAAFYVDRSLADVDRGGIATALQHHGKVYIAVSFESVHVYCLQFYSAT